MLPPHRHARRRSSTPSPPKRGEPKPLADEAEALARRLQGLLFRCAEAALVDEVLCHLLDLGVLELADEPGL